jgi:hypothetical protein
MHQGPKLFMCAQTVTRAHFAILEAPMTRKGEAGQSLAFVALGLVVLMGFAGIAIDMGLLRYDKRLQQTAADAAALAGANDLQQGTAAAYAGGHAASAQNGFTDNGGYEVSDCGSSASVGTVCVEIDIPPVDGPHAGKGGYVEALVAAVQPTYFMRIFQVNQETVTARAVATDLSGATAGNNGCMFTLALPSKKGIEGINVSGHATLNATGCGIMDNGNYDPNDPSITVNNCNFAVVGGDTGNPNSNVMCNGSVYNPTYSVPAGPNPLANLPTACSLGYSCTGGNDVKITDTETLSPGTYDSISVQGNGNVTFSPGVYVIDGSGGFSCNGTPTITGTGVTFYFTGSATYNCTGNDTVNLTAPSSTNCPSCPSQYDGILMYQDPNDTQGPSIGGNVGSTFGGALYFPASEVTFFGNSSTNACGLNVSMVVSAAVGLSGNPTVCMTGQQGMPSGVTSVVTVATLVE